MPAPGSMTDVALRPWPTPKKDAMSKEDVLVQISQLATERGHLREITEKTLQEEIDAGKDIPENTTEGLEHVSKKEEATTAKERLEEIHHARLEMQQKLDWARFSAANALDLISIILSQDKNKKLDNSFSAQFKQQNVPPGSFGMDKNYAPKIKNKDDLRREADTERREQLVMKGSRMEALDWATDDILNAATQLEKEVRKETKYWEQILSISEKGWSIQRLRKDVRHAPFGVRYGLPETSAHFKARGFAPLRMDKDGSIILDPALALKPKILRVRISDSEKISGTSKLPLEGELSELDIEKSIQLARDSLFEEELFHEMSLESRQLLAYGVELRNSIIHITPPGQEGRHRKILIDCVARDETFVGSQDHSQDWLAQNVAETLRLLLAHDHSMRLYRRSQLPPPLTARKREQPRLPLLHTLLAMFHHLNAVDSLHSYLKIVTKTLRSAGLSVSLEASRETTWANLADNIKEPSNNDLSALDQLLEVFTKPFDGLATLSLPSSNSTQSENITIATRTYIGAPTFGAEYKLSLPPSLVSVLNLSQDQARQFKFSFADEVKSYLDWILSLDITHTLLYKEYSGRSVIKSKDARVAILSKGSKKGPQIEKDIVVELQDGKLKVQIGTSMPHSTDAGEETFNWDGTKGEASLKDKVKSWVG